MDTVFTRTGALQSQFEKPFVTWDNSMNQVILKSLDSGVCNCFERHSKYRFPERCVSLCQRCKHVLPLAYCTHDSYSNKSHTNQNVIIQQPLITTICENRFH